MKELDHLMEDLRRLNVRFMESVRGEGIHALSRPLVNVWETDSPLDRENDRIPRIVQNQYDDGKLGLKVETDEDKKPTIINNLGVCYADALKPLDANLFADGNPNNVTILDIVKQPLAVQTQYISLEYWGKTYLSLDTYTLCVIDYASRCLGKNKASSDMDRALAEQLDIYHASYKEKSTAYYGGEGPTEDSKEVLEDARRFILENGEQISKGAPSREDYILNLKCLAEAEKRVAGNPAVLDQYPLKSPS